MRKLLFSFTIVLSQFVAFAQNNVNSTNLYRFEGTYELENNHRVTLGVFDEINKSLVYLDLKSLDLGMLIPINNHQFKDSRDTTRLFSFQLENEKVNTLMLIDGPKTIIAKKINHHTRKEIFFKNQQTELRGALYLPASEGKHPVVVFAHGSGAATRGVGFFTTFFLQLGIGVLTFDKRGAGESMGDWETANFEVLAQDIISGINFLKTQPNVDPSEIGLMGNSQGGWVGSMVASKTKDLAYLLMRVGSGESVLETISHEYRGTFLADGFKEGEINEMIEMYRKHWLAASDGKTWKEGNDILYSYASKPWFNKLYPEPRTETESSKKWWIWLKENLKHDSYPYLKSIKTPTLWLMGEKDWNVNSQKSYPKVKGALMLAGNKEYSVAIIPSMGHTGMVVSTGYYNEPFSWKYADGFWNTIKAWLIERKIAKTK